MSESAAAPTPPVTEGDKTILRDLAKRVAEIAADPIQDDRRELWRRHNRLDPGPRPIVFIKPEGAWRELIPGNSLASEGDRARRFEVQLRQRIYQHEHLGDDAPVEATWDVHQWVRNSGWGLESKHTESTGERGAWAFAPVIHEPADLDKLRMPEIEPDPEAHAAKMAEAHELFDGILEVRRRGVNYAGFHLMKDYTSLRGLEQVMMDMVLEPQMLHDAMEHFTRGHLKVLGELEELGLLALNNDASYVPTGGLGYTDELPAEDFDGEHVRPRDMWGAAEAQELAQVSPQMHREFALQYERRLLERFGLTSYGCCEDLTRKLDDVLELPHIRRISVSPFADLEACAERLGGGYILSWKPKPQMVAGDFDPNLIRRYLRHALTVAKANGCVFDMTLKDTHTCDGRPERFETWRTIAYEEIDRVYG